MHLACIHFVHVIVQFAKFFFGYILDVNAVVLLFKKVCILCAGDRRVQAGERQQVADVFGSARFTKGQSAESIRAITVIALVGWLCLI